MSKKSILTIPANTHVFCMCHTPADCKPLSHAYRAIFHTWFPIPATWMVAIKWKIDVAKIWCFTQLLWATFKTHWNTSAFSKCSQVIKCFWKFSYDVIWKSPILDLGLIIGGCIFGISSKFFSCLWTNMFRPFTKILELPG